MTSQQLWTRVRHANQGEAAPPLQIVAFGAEEWPRGRTYERTDSQMYGIEYVRDGDAELIQDGKRYVVRPGEVYILRKGVNHRYSAGPSGHLRKYYIALDGALLESLLLATGMDTCDHVVSESPMEIEGMLLEARDLMHNKPPDFAFSLSMLAYRLIVTLSRCVARRYPAAITAALEYIDRNLNQTVSSADIHRAAGLSATHFNRLFRQHVGMSPKQFCLRHKMAWAQHLLRDSQYSIKEIASTLGYPDPLYFSSQFRRHTGRSPREFREWREPVD